MDKNVSSLVEEVEQLTNRINDFVANKPEDNPDYKPLTPKLSELEKAIDELKGITDAPKGA